MQEDRAPFGGLITRQGLRQMHRTGWLVLGIWALYLVAYGVAWPEPYSKGGWLVIELFAIGRAVCAYEGVRMGFSDFYLFVQGGAQDIGFCLVVFPWVARFYERVARDTIVDRLLRHFVLAAEKHTASMQRFGAAGLFLFVFFPLAGTGTLVGSIVGYLIGLPMRLVLPIVIAGHLLSLVVLLGFFDWLEPLLRDTNEGVAQYFAWIFLVGIIAMTGLYRGIKRYFFPEDVVSGAPQILEEAVTTSEE